MTNSDIADIKTMLVEHGMKIDAQTAQISELKQDLKEHHAQVGDRLTQLEHWRERAKGAGAVFSVAGGIVGAWIKTTFFTVK